VYWYHVHGPLALIELAGGCGCDEGSCHLFWILGENGDARMSLPSSSSGEKFAVEGGGVTRPLTVEIKDFLTRKIVGG